jgi:Rrf2 family iron-sulfur cluster assembly transcriptional regulator
MKITALDEYGLRILLRVARANSDEGLSISQLSEMEGLSISYVAKLTRTLRHAGLIRSIRGHKGGYILSRPANQITINEVLHALGGALYDKAFCGSHAGDLALCTNSVDCSIRSLWRIVQSTVDRLLVQVTLEDLQGSEKDSAQVLRRLAMSV